MGEILPGAAIGADFKECVSIYACTYGKSERVIVFDDDAVVSEQVRIFKKAGHARIDVAPITLFLNGRDEYNSREMGAGVVHRKAVASRYHRVDLRPGIKVRRYDRVVLKRPRVTAEEAIYVASLLIALTALVVFPFIHVTIHIGKMFHMDGGWRVAMLGIVCLFMTGPAIRWMRYVEVKVEKLFGIPSIEEWRVN